MTSEQSESTRLAELAELRQATYLVLGGLFQYPEQAQLDRLAAVARDLRQGEDLARQFAFFSSWEPALGRIAGLAEDGATHLEQTYTDLFQVGNSRSPCPLYESAYVDTTGREAGWVAARVGRAYAAGGLELSRLARGELPDHVGLELEFMSVLCGREAAAWDAERDGAAVIALRLQRTFLDEHLGRWLPALARRLGAMAEPDNLYRIATESAGAFVAHDRDLVATLLDARQEAEVGVAGERGAA